MLEMESQEFCTALDRQIERYRKILEDHPEDPSALLAYAEACLRRGLRLEALQAYQKVLHIRPVAEAHLGVARIYFLQGHFAEAYEELMRLFAVDPTSMGGHSLLHQLKEKEEPPPELLAHLEFIPSESQLDDAWALLKLEKAQLLREVQDCSKSAGQEGSDPILTYHLEESRKRVEEVDRRIRQLEAWREVAGPEPANVPRAPLVPPRPPSPPPPSVGEVEEEVPVLREAVPSGEESGPSEARRAFYREVGGDLAEVASGLLRTRGVTGVYVYSRDPYPVFQEPSTEEGLGEAIPLLLDGLKALEELSPDLRYWVLECRDGIVVVQRIDLEHFLVVVGRSGANFGAVRFALEKNHTLLAHLLAGAEDR